MTERCPVCGADVDRDDPAATSYFDGDLFYFCCDTCKEEFDANPERFVRIAA
jgi:YHS domain-containing protein